MKTYVMEFGVYSSYQSHGNINTSNLKTLIIAYWFNFFKQPIDTIPIQFEKYYTKSEVLFLTASGMKFIASLKKH